MNTSTIALFCCLCACGCLCEAWERHHLVPTTRKRIRKTKLTLGEMMVIMTLFHLSPCRNFKRFRFHAIERQYRDGFGDLPAYGRLVAPMPGLLPRHPLCQGREKTGTYSIDSTRLAVCHNAGVPGVIGCSGGLPPVVEPQWGGSTASGCTWSSTARAS